MIIIPLCATRSFIAVFLTRQMSSFYRSFSDIFTSALVILLINILSWEDYGVYTLVSQFLGLGGFALGIYIFIRKAQRVSDRNSITHSHEFQHRTTDGRLDSTHLMAGHNGV